LDGGVKSYIELI